MLNSVSLIDLADKLQEVFVWVVAVTKSGRMGGYFCLMEENSSTPIVIMKVGVIEGDGKAARYFALAQEKAKRLFITHSHRSSWQTRNEKEDRWGGAIRSGGFIFSFSGLSEAADELVSLGVAHALGAATQDEFFAIASISTNPHMEEFRQLIKK